MTSCRALSFAGEDEAKRASRRNKFIANFRTEAKYCKECDQWHLVSGDRRVDDLNRQILFKLAQGLRLKEIATDLNISHRKVIYRVEELLRVFNALSSANMIATAIWLKVIDIESLMPGFEEKPNVESNTAV